MRVSNIEGNDIIRTCAAANLAIMNTVFKQISEHLTPTTEGGTLLKSISYSLEDTTSALLPTVRWDPVAVSMHKIASTNKASAVNVKFGGDG